MFGFAQWDSPVSLVLEALISVAIMVVLIFVVRRVNARAEADRERYMQSMVDHRSPGPQDSSSAPNDEQSAIRKNGDSSGDMS